MKLRFLVKLAGLLSCAICLVAQAQEQPSMAEVIEIVDKVTGCGKDALTSLYGESPALFDNVADTVTATRVVNKILEARDEDAALEVFKWQLNKSCDEILKQFLDANNLAPALKIVSAMKAYAAALELVRDYVFIPKLDEAMFQAYKTQRSGAGGGSPDDAFTEATTRSWSGYQAIKPKMVAQYIKAKGWDSNLVGEEMRKSVEKNIDKYWVSRLEARYQKDLLKEQVPAVQKAIWQTQTSHLNAIKAAASKFGCGPGFFLIRSEINALDPFKLSEYTFYTNPQGFSPRKESNAMGDSFTQAFHIISRSVTEKKRPNSVQKEPAGAVDCFAANGTLLNNGPFVHVVIRSDPRILRSTYQGKPYEIDLLDTEKDLKQYDKHPFIGFVRKLDEPGMAYGHLLRKGSKDGSPGEKGYMVIFFTDKFRITAYVEEIPSIGPEMAESLVQRICRIVLSKMR